MKTQALLIQIDAEKDRQGIKKNRLCSNAGISPRHYEKALSGTGSMTVEKLQALCKALDLTLTISLDH